MQWFPSIRDPRRNALIDLIRGGSIALVLCSHFQRLSAIFGDHAGHIFGRELGNIGEGLGYYGVCIFFVVSGFLITSGALRRYGPLSRIDFSSFWRLRLARIVPMVVLCVYALALFHALGIPHFVLTSTVLVEKVIASIFAFRFNAVIGTDLSVGVWNPMWSLSVEEMFYLVFPLVCLAINGKPAAIWLGVAIIALASYCRLNHSVGYYSTVGCMDLLTFGCLLAVFEPARLRGRWGAARARIAGTAAGLAGSALCVFAMLKWHPFSHDDLRGPLICGLGAVLLLTASQLVALPRSLRWAAFPVTGLGVLSYEIYLIHMPLASALRTAFGADGWVFIFAAILLGLLTHEGFSEPMNRALRSGASAVRCVVLAIGPIVAITLAGFALCVAVQPVKAALVIDRLAPLAAGACEPVAYTGRSQLADLVLLRHTSGGNVQFGVDHWGAGQVAWGPELAPAAVLQHPFTISFGTTGVAVRSGDALWAASLEPRASQSRTVHVGINDLQFSTAGPAAESRITSVR